MPETAGMQHDSVITVNVTSPEGHPLHLFTSDEKGVNEQDKKMLIIRYEPFSKLKLLLNPEFVKNHEEKVFWKEITIIPLDIGPRSIRSPVTFDLTHEAFNIEFGIFREVFQLEKSSETKLVFQEKFGELKELELPIIQTLERDNLFSTRVIIEIKVTCEQCPRQEERNDHISRVPIKIINLKRIDCQLEEYFPPLPVILEENEGRIEGEVKFYFSLLPVLDVDFPSPIFSIEYDFNKNFSKFLKVETINPETWNPSKSSNAGKTLVLLRLKVKEDLIEEFKREILSELKESCFPRWGIRIKGPLNIDLSSLPWLDLNCAYQAKEVTVSQPILDFSEQVIKLSFRYHNLPESIYAHGFSAIPINRTIQAHTTLNAYLKGFVKIKNLDPELFTFNFDPPALNDYLEVTLSFSDFNINNKNKNGGVFQFPLDLTIRVNPVYIRDFIKFAIANVHNDSILSNLRIRIHHRQVKVLPEQVQLICKLPKGFVEE